MRLLAQLAQIFRTPISDLNRLPLWALSDLVELAKEQERQRKQHAKRK